MQTAQIGWGNNRCQKHKFAPDTVKRDVDDLKFNLRGWHVVGGCGIHTHLDILLSIWLYSTVSIWCGWTSAASGADYRTGQWAFAWSCQHDLSCTACGWSRRTCSKCGCGAGSRRAGETGRCEMWGCAQNPPSNVRSFENVTVLWGEEARVFPDPFGNERWSTGGGPQCYALAAHGRLSNLFLWNSILLPAEGLRLSGMVPGGLFDLGQVLCSPQIERSNCRYRKGGLWPRVAIGAWGLKLAGGPDWGTGTLAVMPVLQALLPTVRRIQDAWLIILCLTRVPTKHLFYRSSIRFHQTMKEKDSF